MSLLERDTVMVSTDEEGNAVVDLPHTRANNVEGLGRSFNTYYSVGNVVYVDSNLSVALKCTNAGTTSNTELDISDNNVGDTVTDGSVVWVVVKRDLSEEVKANANNFANYLPLSGGALTGDLIITNNKRILSKECAMGIYATMDGDQATSAVAAFPNQAAFGNYKNSVLLRSYNPSNLDEFIGVAVTNYQNVIGVEKAQNNTSKSGILLDSLDTIYVKAKGTENGDTVFNVPDGGTWSGIIARSIGNIPYFNTFQNIAGGTTLFTDNGCKNGWLFAWRVS